VVGVAVGGVELDLGGEVAAGVHLLEHVERRELRVAQVRGGVHLVDAARDRLLVAAAGEHVLPLLAHHDGGPGVLTGGQHAARRDVGVLEQLERDEPVVLRRLRILEDARQLRQVPRPQEVRDVPHRLARQQRERLGVHTHERLPRGLEGGNALAAQPSIGDVLMGQIGQQGLELKVGHCWEG
jgi:hypothetical protein